MLCQACMHVNDDAKQAINPTGTRTTTVIPTVSWCPTEKQPPAIQTMRNAKVFLFIQHRIFHVYRVSKLTALDIQTPAKVSLLQYALM